MQDFERAFMRALRQVFDTEKQLAASARAISVSISDRRLVDALTQIEQQSVAQATRLEALFELLYLEPRGEACWATTAMLREATDSCAGGAGASVQGCAAALLAIKRYEITLYESLLRWSEQCHLYEVVPDLRRSIAEELVQASALSDIAFKEISPAEATRLDASKPTALH